VPARVSRLGEAEVGDMVPRALPLPGSIRPSTSIACTAGAASRARTRNRMRAWGWSATGIAQPSPCRPNTDWRKSWQRNAAARHRAAHARPGQRAGAWHAPTTCPAGRVATESPRVAAILPPAVPGPAWSANSRRTAGWSPATACASRGSR
jgi:hypothetical protein